MALMDEITDDAETPEVGGEWWVVSVHKKLLPLKRIEPCTRSKSQGIVGSVSG